VGGALIGASASALLLLNGRIAGISGIFGSLLLPQVEGNGAEVRWRGLFLCGLLAGGLLLTVASPQAIEPPRSPWAILVIGGLLVGIGTRLAAGCTSGHGVCGLSRMSGRSVAATLTFMAFGVTTATIVHHVLGVPQ
jgi:hypothetical protein